MSELGLNVEFNPSGIYIQNEGVFHLNFEFYIFFGSDRNIHDREIMNGNMLAVFKFEESIEFENIPQFFYTNSIAIAFPHLRGFISVVTTLAQTRRLILPLLNLTALESVLRSNTVQQ